MKSKKMIQTTSLFALPSFTSGIARVVDVGGKFASYDTSRSDEEADRKALRSDWRAVGKDIEDAMISLRR